MAGVTATQMRAELRALGNRDIAAHAAGFFKAGKGEYGEGDRFLGIRVPNLRQQVRRFRDAPERSVLAMLKSKYREERLFAVLLLEDDKDLIHKVVGWMLRDVGNRDRAVEEAFLEAHYKRMPRTMLRYAIGKFPERRRRAYLHGAV